MSRVMWCVLPFLAAGVVLAADEPKKPEPPAGGAKPPAAAGSPAPSAPAPSTPAQAAPAPSTPAPSTPEPAATSEPLAAAAPAATTSPAAGAKPEAKAPAKAEESPDLGMSILGNQEAPKALVIVPWKTSEMGDAHGISTMLDDSRLPVDREVFMRLLSYYEVRSNTAPTAPGRKR